MGSISIKIWGENNWFSVPEKSLLQDDSQSLRSLSESGVSYHKKIRKIWLQ
jgi:hypothetical protein